MQSETINDLSAALAKAQGQMKAAPFNKTVNFSGRSYKYADLASVIDAIRKPLSDNGLAITQTTEIREKGFVLVTTLRHATGQWVASEYPLPRGAKPQELGSALTYAKRYSITSMVCISADEDDDAQAAEASGHKASEPRPNPHVTQPEDLSDITPRYDENGQRIDWIDTTDHRVERLGTTKARDLAALLNKAMMMCSTADELVAWGEEHSEQVATLPVKWETIFQNRYTERLDELRAAKEAAE
jgi:hypothetical protein